MYSMADTSLTGFDTATQPTEYCKDLEPTGNVVLHQGDVGEYLRSETTGLIWEPREAEEHDLSCTPEFNK